MTDFICRHVDDKFYLEGTQRVSIRSIIAREIVSNILMHREYTSPYPAKVIVEKGRILTENANKTYHYGRILDTTSPYPKNPLIARFFNNIGRADELGSDVRNLYKYTKIYSDSEPVLFEDDVFKVEVPLSGIATADKPPINTDKREDMIIDYIKRNGSISNKEACDLLGLKDSSVKKIFEKMVKAEALVPIGEKKSRRYVIEK